MVRINYLASCGENEKIATECLKVFLTFQTCTHPDLKHKKCQSFKERMSYKHYWDERRMWKAKTRNNTAWKSWMLLIYPNTHCNPWYVHFWYGKTMQIPWFKLSTWFNECGLSRRPNGVTSVYHHKSLTTLAPQEPAPLPIWPIVSFVLTSHTVTSLQLEAGLVVLLCTHLVH